MIVSAIGCHTPAQGPSSLSCKKPAPCKVRIVFSKPVHAVRARGGPAGTNHGLFKAKPSSHHVHSTLPVSAIGCHTPAQRPSSLSCKKPDPCKMRVVFSKPVHAVRARGGPAGTNHGLFKAKPSSHHVHSTLPVSAIGCHTPAQRPSSLSCKKPDPCKVRVVFSKPVHAVRARSGPAGTNHGLFKAKPSSHHVHSTLPVNPPTSPCPTVHSVM